MNDEQLLRYSRHLMLKDFDVAGQEKLLAATVLIIGLGGLGCPIAMYLASSGIGHLVLADFDVVDLSNLQRQIAHGTNDIATSKVASAAATIQALNPDVKLTCISDKLTDQALLDTVRKVDLVVDASDNFATRFAINRACWQTSIPLVSGAAIRAQGQVIWFDPGQQDSPCYRCLYDDSYGEENLSCSQSGVLAPLVGVIGSFQALLAVNILSGYAQMTPGQLLVLDGRYGQWRELRIPKDKYCPVCST